MITTLLLCLPLPAASVPAAVPSAPDAAVAQDPEKKKREFPKLNGTSKRKLDKALYAVGKAKTDEAVAEAVATVQELGAGAVPACLEAFAKTEGERREVLVGLLDGLLTDADLDLAWKAVDKKTPADARAYLARRTTDSEREDAVAMLKERLADEDDEVVYQAARGLVLRGERAGIEPTLLAFQKRWTKQSKQLRQEFASVERGKLSAPLVPMIQNGGRAERLAAIHLFELVGVQEQAKVLLFVLDEKDSRLQLAAVNALRVVVDGDEPLSDRTSTMQIIDHLENWKGRF